MQKIKFIGFVILVAALGGVAGKWGWKRLLYGVAAVAVACAGVVADAADVARRKTA